METPVFFQVKTKTMYRPKFARYRNNFYSENMYAELVDC